MSENNGLLKPIPNPRPQLSDTVGTIAIFFWLVAAPALSMWLMAG